MGISIAMGELECDLHNNYDFCGYAFKVTERALLLSWKKTSGSWAPMKNPVAVTLQVLGVRAIEIAPRDPAMPFTEDDCLSGIYFRSDEAWGREPFMSDETPDDSWQWIFEFMSGVCIGVDAEEIVAIMDDPPSLNA